MSYYYHSITGHSVQPENVILDETLCFESKYKLRAGDYVHLTGELQIADSISVNDIVKVLGWRFL